MSDSHYDLVIQHNASVEPVDRLVRDLLILLDKEGDPYIEYKLSEGLLFPETKTALLENITKDEAEYYQKRFREMQVETSLRPTMQLSLEKNEPPQPSSNDMHVCPACHHEQPRSRSGMNTCQNCNLVAEKYQRHQRREDILAKESRIYKFQQDKLMRDALEKARLSEEEQLRREARLQLSLENKKRPLDIAIGVTAIALMVLAGILIITTIQRKADINLEEAQQQAYIANQLKIGMKTVSQGVLNKQVETTAIDSSQTEEPENLTKPPEGEEDEVTENLADQEQTQEPLPEEVKPPNPDRQIVTQADIDKLKILLEADAPNPYFSKISPEQFKIDEQKLARLLELNKPELAIAFVNEANDHYAASLLLLDIVRAELQKNHHDNEGDILRTFNVLMSRAPTLQQPLVNASFSLLLRLQGQDDNAHTALQPTLDDLKATDNSLLFIADNQFGDSGQIQKLGIILQMIKDHHHFAQTEAAKSLIQIAEQMLANLPDEALTHTEAMTLLASACVVVGDKSQAKDWLEKITDGAAREQLLDKLKNS